MTDPTPPYRVYYHHGAPTTEEHPTTEACLRAQYWGADGGYIAAAKVVNENGETVWDRESDPDIFTFCEQRGFGWTDD